MSKELLKDKIKSGAINIYSENDLNALLESGNELTIKLGADPSRPDLHIGHSVVLRKLKLFQELGHNIIFVIGDFTGMIGDPTGKSKTRPQLSLEETRHSGQSYFEQVTKILDKEKTQIRYNSDWLVKMNFEEMIKLTSKYTLARILERDDFKNRYKENMPIGLHELLYPLVQGYDSVAIKADIEVGGTDQTFNLLVGRHLQELYNQKPQVVITYPLLPGLDGSQKMSKSLDNYIGINEDADVMFEKCMKVPDSLLLEYFHLTTDISKSEAEHIMTKDIRDAHFKYAKTIVSMYHDLNSADIAKSRYLNIASGNIPQTIKEVIVNTDDITIIELVKLAGFASSNSEARSNILGRGIKINGTTVQDVYRAIKIEGELVLQFGKNRFVKIVRSK